MLLLSSICTTTLYVQCSVPSIEHLCSLLTHYLITDTDNNTINLLLTTTKSID